MDLVTASIGLAANQIYVGTPATFTAEFVVDGAAGNPGDAQISVTDPYGNVTVHTAAALVNTAPGIYVFAQVCATIGVWRAAVACTLPAPAGAATAFNVVGADFGTPPPYSPAPNQLALYFSSLPTFDPHTVGAAWNDGGVLAISGG